MVNETTVKTFLTLMHTGSITEAANHLFLTQQAVSKQLSKLEQDLGCTLFLRERGKLILTPVGEVYYKAFSEMDQLLTGARQTAARMSGEWENTLSIGQPELLDIHAFSYPYLREFQDSNPDVKVSFHSAPLWNIIKWLEEGSADAIYTWENELEGRLDIGYIPLIQVRTMLVVSANHPKATASATYMDFKDEPILCTEIPEGGEQDPAYRLRSIGFPTGKMVMTDNMLSSCAAVDQLQGITFFAENCQILQNHRYRAYPTPNRITMVLAYRQNNEKQSLRHLLEAAKAWAANRGGIELPDDPCYNSISVHSPAENNIQC